MPHFASCILLLSVAACSPQPNGATASGKTSGAQASDSLSSLAAMDSTQAQFLAAYTRKDLDGILGLYADDIRLVIEGRIYDGMAAVREAWMRSLPTLSGLTFKPVSRAVQGGLGVRLESFSQKFAEPGKPEQTDSGYSLAVMRRRPDGRWVYQTVALSRPPQMPAEAARGRPRSR